MLSKKYGTIFDKEIVLSVLVIVAGMLDVSSMKGGMTMAEKEYKVADFVKQFGVSRQAIQQQIDKLNIKPTRKQGRANIYDWRAEKALEKAYDKNLASEGALLHEMEKLTAGQEEIQEQLDRVHDSLSADKSTEVNEHVAELLKEHASYAAYEYAKTVADEVSPLTDKVNDLTGKIDALIEEQKYLVEQIKQLQNIEQNKRYVNTRKAILESFAYYENHRQQLVNADKEKERNSNVVPFN